jgi:crossover junction endodeoxyribonuclease RusA
MAFAALHRRSAGLVFGGRGMMIVTLPWPTGPLWPNRRPHWSVRAKHVAKARRDAWALCLEAGAPKGEAELRVAFHPPDRGRRDVQNAVAAMKAQIDGIADALGVDDSRLRIEWPIAFAEPVKGGAVVVEIAP